MQDGLGGLGSDRAEQLLDGAERERLLELAPDRAVDGHGRDRAGLGQQRGLADPGRPAHERAAAALEHAAQRGEFGIALEQKSQGSSPGVARARLARREHLLRRRRAAHHRGLRRVRPSARRIRCSCRTCAATIRPRCPACTRSSTGSTAYLTGPFTRPAARLRHLPGERRAATGSEPFVAIGVVAIAIIAVVGGGVIVPATQAAGRAGARVGRVRARLPPLHDRRGRARRGGADRDLRDGGQAVLING